MTTAVFRDLMDRRSFLILGLSLLAPARLGAEAFGRRGTFAAEIGILYQVLTFRLAGEIQENLDRVAGRYNVRLTGQGDGIANHVESSGILRGGRWVPLRGTSWFQIRGRESRLEITYDYDRRVIEYHGRGETFFLRRLRVVDDVLSLPAGLIVDDGISALLNYRDGHWTPGADGLLRTYVVRRHRTVNEGPDDIAAAYRAEVIPLDLRIEIDPKTRRPAALLDLSRFSSWARQEHPARIVFNDERRPALITGSMILGTSVTIRLT
jgi:hypothetical protein